MHLAKLVVVHCVTSSQLDWKKNPWNWLARHLTAEADVKWSKTIAFKCATWPHLLTLCSIDWCKFKWSWSSKCVLRTVSFLDGWFSNKKLQAVTWTTESLAGLRAHRSCINDCSQIRHCLQGHCEKVSTRTAKIIRINCWCHHSGKQKSSKSCQ